MLYGIDREIQGLRANMRQEYMHIDDRWIM